MINNVNDFQKFGNEYGSDKVIEQSYQKMYAFYLGHRREEKLRILEIGPGCESDRRVESSIQLWRKYIPAAHLTYFGRDQSCSSLLGEGQVDQLFFGNQSQMSIVTQVQRGGPYDVIVDEGARTRMQQVNAFVGLWPALKSGGAYFFESMHLWHYEEYDDSISSPFEIVGKLIYMLINQKGAIIANPNRISISNELKSVFLSVLSVNCYYHGCVVMKKGE